jgi:tetratricopeptide (TPR) repeat protein
MTNHFRVVADYDRALVCGARALGIAAHRGHFALQVMTHEFFGIVYYLQGNYRQARDVLMKNVAALQGELLYDCFGLAGLPSVISRAWLLSCLACLGDFLEGIAHGEEAMQIAEAADHPFRRMGAYVSIGTLYLGKGDFQRATPMLEQGLALGEVTDIRVFPHGPWALSLAHALSGRVAEALQQLEQAPAWMRSFRYH